MLQAFLCLSNDSLSDSARGILVTTDSVQSPKSICLVPRRLSSELVHNVWGRPSGETH